MGSGDIVEMDTHSLPSSTVLLAEGVDTALFVPAHVQLLRLVDLVVRQVRFQFDPEAVAERQEEVARLEAAPLKKILVQLKDVDLFYFTDSVRRKRVLCIALVRPSARDAVGMRGVGSRCLLGYLASEMRGGWADCLARDGCVVRVVGRDLDVSFLGTGFKLVRPQSRNLYDPPPRLISHRVALGCSTKNTPKRTSL